MSEALTEHSELPANIQQFVDGLTELAPSLAEGQTARFIQAPTQPRTSWEGKYSCNIIPNEDTSRPPTVYLFQVWSPICYERQAYTFDSATRRYMKTATDFEPNWETMPPEEIEYEPVQASDLELGKVLGILKTLRPKPADETEAQPSTARRVAQALFPHS
jgi:hypothetical protein